MESESDVLEYDSNALCSELCVFDIYTELFDELDIYFIDESKFETSKLESRFYSRILESD